VDVRRKVGELLGSLADRLGMSPWAIVAGSLAVVAAGFGGWWAFAAPAPPPVEQLLPRVDGASPVAEPVAEPAVGDLRVVVHVDGAVVRPGVHELVDGSRVINAIEAAGGLLVDADRERLNLAAPVADGQRVWVPWVGEEEPAVVPVIGGSGSATNESGPGVVNLNTADTAALETLPGIGPSIAAAIIRHRESEGLYQRVDDLLEVAGIGPSRLAQLEALVTV
jgi:competence protein ComEA